MWAAEHSTTTTADAGALWERWTNPECWPEQDRGTEWARLDGPLAVGTRIRLKPSGSVETSTTITTLEPFGRFTSESKIPFGKMTFDHLATRDGATILFTHRITITGPLTPVFRRLFADEMARSLPEMMESVARHAEGANVGR
ncbi:MAG TPA: hypothetical protein VGS16_04460 [Candidatus Dormibacteraeota bacterium]|nr:hypothetical protein [Candidatus Dormibacteraeota bacterium]